jgi:hypothetical protein
MTDEIKTIDIKEFRERGYLHEVNRLVLHPLGLALSVKVNEDGTEELGPIWDYRHDPEGIIFGDDLLSAEKAIAVRREMFERRGERIKRLGFVVQPIKGEVVLTTNYTDPTFFDQQT